MNDYRVYRLKKKAYVINVVELFLLSCVVFYYFVLLFFNETHDDWPVWLGAIVFFSFFVYRISRKIIKIKLSRDSLVLYTRYGEKKFSFSNLQHELRVIEDAQNLCIVFNKNKQSFVVEEKDFPEVTMIIYEKYRNSVSQMHSQNEEQPDFVVYKPLTKKDGLYEVVIWTIIVIAWFSVLLCIVPSLEIKVYIFLVGSFFLFLCYCNSKNILEVKWYEDRFILCTLYGEKIFLFDKTTPYKVEKSKNGIVRLVFKKGFQSFVVNELDFPEAVKKMKIVFNVDK